MTDSAKNHFEERLPDEKLSPDEFTKRVTRYLFVCIQGMCDLLAENDPLHAKLEGLRGVIRKVLSPVPPSGLARDIGAHFAKLKLEKEFGKTGAEELKQIILELSIAVKEMSNSTGLMDHEMEGFIDKIQVSGSVSELASIKTLLVQEVRGISGKIKSFSSTVSFYRESAEKLAERLHKTQVQAMVDSLTNILNRAAYDLKIGQVIREYARYREPTALVLIDIDHFKKINDNYGHKAGDEVLKSVASSIQSATRTTDYLFRYGGEEFVVVLSKIQKEDAGKLAEKIRHQVEKDYFVHAGKQLKVTVSLGVSGLRDGDTEIALFERADKAMYAAKQKGRNRVEVAE